MASTNPQKNHIAEIKALASELQSQISTATIPPHSLSLGADLCCRLDKYLSNPLLLSRAGAASSLSSRRELDSCGTGLWNACMRLRSIIPKSELGLLNRENDQLDLGLDTLGTAAARLNALEKSESGVETQSLATEYYMLRVFLSSLQGRPDIAEHMFSKVAEPKLEEDRKIILEICCNVGTWAMACGQYGMASKWLERAVGLNGLLGRGFRHASRGLDVRLIVLHTLARAYLQVDTTDSWNRLLKILKVLEAYGGHFAILLLRTEVLSRQAQPNIHEYYGCAALQVMDLTDGSINAMFVYILKLKDWSLELTSQSLQRLLLHVHFNKRIWTERIFVTFVWTLTDLAFCSQDGLDRLEDTLAQSSTRWQSPLSIEACHACLILIWRKVDAVMSQGNYYIAERWCQFVLGHSAFQNCSFANKAKFQRRLIICAWENSNYILARETLNRMSDDCKSHPLTLYMRYKLALVDEDIDTAIIYQQLPQLGKSGTAYMLACVAEARRMGKTEQVTQGLQHTVERLDNGFPESIFNIPGLFQSTLHLLSMELENYKPDKAQSMIIEQILRVFEAALREANRAEEKSAAFLPTELEWFFINSYNSALQSLKFASSKTAFAELYQQKEHSNNGIDVHRHFLLCDFHKSTALLSEARMEDDPLIRETYYRSLRSSSHNFRTRIHSHLAKSPGTETEQLYWTRKYRAVIAFDVEATVSLKQWSDIVSIIEEAREMEIVDDWLLSVFMDCILSSSSVPGEETLRIIELILSILVPSANPNPSYKDQPRYIHSLFHLCISTPTEQTNHSKTKLAESILFHALTLARQARNASTTITSTDTTSPTTTAAAATTTTGPDPYPDEELEWLATVTFNRAVDFYLTFAEEDCKRWAGRAIELADLLDDDGALGRLLRVNLARLGVDMQV
ncbi:hypothetical protein MPDQ_004665 [Monascus purpureus]|uniref:Protein ZIP4 homolog n=1 Tax=Monascus purpureus TaxID=5098 RepID=A0A507QZT5_MONPU|nr:hypothetical protein MPDQ_004665 [Monascus purpureus]